MQKESGNGHDMNVSLFERLVQHGYPHHELRMQHRMRPNISAVVRDLQYPQLLDSPLVHNLPGLKGAQASLMFIDHSWPERSAGASKEPSNNAEFAGLYGVY